MKPHRQTARKPVLKRLLHNNDGSGNQYLQAGILAIIAIPLLFGVMDSALLFNSVIKMNNTAELVSKKIQLSGAVDSETQYLLKESLEHTRIHDYVAVITIEEGNHQQTVTVTPSSVTTKKVQLNDTYTVTVKGSTSFLFADLAIGGKAVGISEVYSK